MKPHIPILAALLSATAALVAVVLAATPAFANPVQTNTGNGAPSQAQVYGSGSAASSAQQQRQHQTQGQTATGGRSSATGGRAASTASGGNSNVSVAASGDAYGRIPVASAIPGTIVNGGCNTGGASGVVQTPLLGVGGTLGGRQDIVCQSNEIGRPDVAFAYLCLKDRDYARASDFTAHPCPQFEHPKPVMAETVSNDAPDFCYTASAGERRQHWQCRGVRYE